jgi:hypothetical protein
MAMYLNILQKFVTSVLLRVDYVYTDSIFENGTDRI